MENFRKEKVDGEIIKNPSKINQVPLMYKGKDGQEYSTQEELQEANERWNVLMNPKKEKGNL